MATTYVANFAELKIAVEDSTTTDITATGDITFSGGIKVNIAKPSLVIDFNGHNVVDNNTLSFTDTIYIASTTNTVSVTVKNAVWSGRNYYGVVGVYDGNINSTITYENINYTGPQCIYNKNGRTVVSNSTFTLSRNGSSANPQEFGEVNRIEIKGNVVVKDEGTANAVLWFTNTGSSLIVDKDANFTVEAPSTYMMYTDSQPDLIFREGSNTKITTLNGLFYSTGTSSHIANSFLLEEGASFSATQTSSNATPLFKCVSAFTANANSTFNLFSPAKNTTALMYFAKAANITITQPQNVVLYNNGGPIFNFQTGSASSPNVLSISAEMMRLWDSAKTPLANAGGIDDEPTTSIYKESYASDISIKTNISNSALLTLESNLASGDSGYPLSTSNFKLLTSNVISMGKMSLAVNQISDLDDSVTGTTNSLANLQVGFMSQTFSGTAEDGGSFSVAISPRVAADTKVSIITNKNFLTKQIEVTSVGSVSVTNAETLKFYAFVSPTDQGTVKRINPNWEVEVTDTRTSGGDWYLYAHIDQPLHLQDENLENALIFKTDSAQVQIDTNPVLVYTGSFGSPPQVTKISWLEDEGFLLNIESGKKYSAGQYSTDLIWEVTETKK